MIDPGGGITGVGAAAIWPNSAVAGPVAGGEPKVPNTGAGAGLPNNPVAGGGAGAPNNPTEDADAPKSPGDGAPNVDVGAAPKSPEGAGAGAPKPNGGVGALHIAKNLVRN